MSTRIILVALALLVCGTATAGESRGLVYDEAGADDVALGALGLGLLGFGHVLGPSDAGLTRAELAKLDKRDLNSFDRSAVSRWSPDAARASDYFASAATVAPLALLAGKAGRNEAGELGLMYAETLLLSSGLTFFLKNIVGRTRPYAYNEAAEIPAVLKFSRTTCRSFPSGHTASAFAALVFTAVVYDDLYPDRGLSPWLWGGCLGAAATTGYLRYRAGMHFPTDVIAGAAIGAFAGWFVPHLHEAKPDAESSGQGVAALTVGF